MSAMTLNSLAGEVRRGARAEGAERQLAGLGLGQCHQFLQRVGLHGRVGQQHQWRGTQDADRLEGLVSGS